MVLTWSGDPRKPPAGLIKAAPDYEALAARLIECCTHLLAMRAAAAMVGALAGGLRAGQAFAHAYGEAKRAAGVVDFDDLIRWAEQLLLEPGMGEWVRYKLDQRTDHILVDEPRIPTAASGTSSAPSRWNISPGTERRAASEPSSPSATTSRPSSASRAPIRKASTSPAWFAREARSAPNSSICRSTYRSAPPILAVVDRLLAGLGHDALGLPARPNPHGSHHQERLRIGDPLVPGHRRQWGGGRTGRGRGGGRLGQRRCPLATRLAQQIRAWLDLPFRLECRGRPLRPEDILVLVRRRGDLASRCWLPGSTPRACRSPASTGCCCRRRSASGTCSPPPLAAQPLDLNLASCWSRPCSAGARTSCSRPRPDGRGALAAAPPAAPPSDETLDGLHALLAMADFATPHGFFEAILRVRSTAAASCRPAWAEARDPIEELLSSALQFEAAGPLSLQAFLDWFERGEVEIVRDPSGPLDAVRVMTVHGAKGLQSPVVILADACADPDRSRNLPGRFPTFAVSGDAEVPVLRPRKEELAEPLRSRVEKQARLEREEHWRLLYVALTRAEERLFVGGALGVRDRNGPPQASWYRAVEQALDELGCGWSDSERWGRELRFGDPVVAGRKPTAVSEPAILLPGWLQPAPPRNGRRGRSLPPPLARTTSPTRRRGRSRGRRRCAAGSCTSCSSALERDRRRALGGRWLERSAGSPTRPWGGAARRRLPGHRGSALRGAVRRRRAPEAPVAAVIGDGVVVSGTVDRLFVGDGRVLVADFKTGRNVPAGTRRHPRRPSPPDGGLPGRASGDLPNSAVEAALLYTAAPVLHALPDALLAAHLPTPAEAMGG